MERERPDGPGVSGAGDQAAENPPPQGRVGDSEWDMVRTEDQVPEYALLSY